MDEDAAFIAFVDQHFSALLQTAFLLTGSPDAAQDLVQDTFTHLYPRWARVVAADQPVAYVRRSLTNLYVTSRRRGWGRREQVSMWDLPDGWDGRDLAQSVTDRGLVWSLLGGLSARQRTAIVLRYFHDLPDDAIADILSCRPVTVRSLISRGLSAMRTDATHLVSVRDIPEVRS